jgi:hypothetical protein
MKTNSTNLTAAIVAIDLGRYKSVVCIYQQQPSFAKDGVHNLV